MAGIRWVFYPILIGTLLLTQACFAQPAQNQIFNFGLNDDGQWVSVSADSISNYSDTSRVVCSSNTAEIELTWAAESGDWVIYDKYRSDGTFFTRTIWFAASEHIIQVTKQSRNSRPIVRIGSPDVAQYDFLLTEPRVITLSSAFPFPLPNCASAIFTRR